MQESAIQESRMARDPIPKGLSARSSDARGHSPHPSKRNRQMKLLGNTQMRRQPLEPLTKTLFSAERPVLCYIDPRQPHMIRMPKRRACDLTILECLHESVIRQVSIAHADFRKHFQSAHGFECVGGDEARK
jgi:hypothetical protein